MGLPGGKNSLKRYICEHHPSACVRSGSFEMAMRETTSNRDSTIVCKDGNIMMMAVPLSVRTVDEYVECIYNQLAVLMQHAGVVVVCFDEPDAVPIAKSATQARRDARATSASDETVPIGDDYDSETMNGVHDVHVLIKQRPTRYRAFDEVMLRVTQRIVQAESMESELNPMEEFEMRRIVFDGIDARGASRPPNESRNPGIFSNDGDLSREICRRRPYPIGEADMKLQHIASIVTSLYPSAPRFTVLDTVDTDNLPIALLRYGEDADFERQYICMRERGSYAKRKRLGSNERDSSDVSNETAGVLLLHPSSIVRGLFENAEDALKTVAQDDETRFKIAVHSLIFFTACCWAITGCDFVQPEIGHTDVVTSVALQFGRANLEEVVSSVVRCTQEWNSEETLSCGHAQLVCMIRKVASCAGSRLSARSKVRTVHSNTHTCAHLIAFRTVHPLQQACSMLLNVEDWRLRRSIWTAFYWSDPETPPSRPLP